MFEFQLDFQNCSGETGGHLTAHLLHQFPHDGKTKTSPARGTGGAALIEPVKQVVRVRGGARAKGVGEAEYPLLGGDSQCAAAVPDCVGNQIPVHPLQR